VYDGKEYAVAGTKGYLWIESDMANQKGLELDIDMSYFEKLADDAKLTIEKFGSFEEFVS
jgi:hypothetical protein